MNKAKPSSIWRPPYPFGIIGETFLLTVAVIAISVTLLVNSDKLLAAPGIAESKSFRSGLRKNMSRKDVQALQTQRHGSGYGSIDSLTLEDGQDANIAQNDPYQKLVWFTIGGGFC